MPSFVEIPTAWRVPLAAAEINTSANRSAGGSYPYRVLIVGQRLAAGTVAELVPTRITSDRQAVTAFGASSMLAQMVAAYRAIDPITELWAVALDDNAAGVKATKTITITGPATADGTISLYIGGRKIECAVTSGDVQNTIAAALEAAIDAESDIPFVASSATNVVTLTAQHKGAVQQTIDVRVNYASDEATPAGLTIAIANGTSGITNPDIQDVIDVLGDVRYDVIVQPYTDSSNLTALGTFLTATWDAMDARDSVCLTAMNGTVSSLGTLGDTRNDKYMGIVQATSIPNPIYEVAAAAGARMAYHGNIDAGQPFNTLALTGILPPAPAERSTKEEQNTLLYDGISPVYVDDNGVVRLVELITLNRTDALGAEDTTWLYFNDVLTYKYIRRDFTTTVTAKFPRYKLARDGYKVPAGQSIITPKGFLAEYIAMYRAWMELGHAQDVETVKANMSAEINTSNSGRLDCVLPVYTIKGLRFLAGQLQFG